MGKVNRLHDRIEPLAALFWLSRQCTVLGNILTLLSGPVSLRRTPSMVRLPCVRWWIVGLIPSEDAHGHPPLPSYSMLHKIFNVNLFLRQSNT